MEVFMTDAIFNEVKKNFGFGCMRLPMKEDEVDYAVFSEMIKTFFDSGFNYFDTAHGYIDGKSELAIKKCLTSKYPRESYLRHILVTVIGYALQLLQIREQLGGESFLGKALAT